MLKVFEILLFVFCYFCDVRISHAFFQETSVLSAKCLDNMALVHTASILESISFCTHYHETYLLKTLTFVG